MRVGFNNSHNHGVKNHLGMVPFTLHPSPLYAVLEPIPTGEPIQQSRLQPKTGVRALTSSRKRPSDNAFPVCYRLKLGINQWILRVRTPASSGEYVPVLVDHSDELPCRGQYYLHHGLQRRIRITLVHTSTSDLKWKDVREVVVGRIRYGQTLVDLSKDNLNTFLG